MSEDIRRALHDPQPTKTQAPLLSVERRRAAAAFLGRAAALRRAGNIIDSLGALRQAIAADPGDPRAHFDLGLTLLACSRHAEAAAAFQEAVARKPDYAEAYYQLGIALQTTGENDLAIVALRRAGTLQPRLTDAHWRLGCLLQLAGREAESREAFRRGAAAGRHTTLGRVCKARELVLDEKLDAAAAVLERTLARDPDDVEATTLLAHVYTFAGHLEAAVRQYQKAIGLAPDQALPLTSLSQVKRMTEADQPVIERMISLLQRPNLPEPQRMDLHFALGKSHDDLGQYEVAMTHFDAANRIRRRFSGFQREPFQRLVDLTISQCSREFFAERAAVGSNDETPLLILGMPRSGTTLLETIVSSHPQVAAAGEQSFWMDHASVMDRGGPAEVPLDTFARMAGDYLRVLRRFSNTALRITDKMLFSFLWLAMIHTALPKARIIHCRRNPVDTCLSIYFTNFQTRRGFFSDRDDLVFYYRQYQRLMDLWRSVLPSNRLLEVDYEALIADREAETRRLIDFCGLQWNDACLAPEQNQRVVRTASMWQVRQPVYRSSVARWKRYEPWLGGLRELLSPDVIDS